MKQKKQVSACPPQGRVCVIRECPKFRAEPLNSVPSRNTRGQIDALKAKFIEMVGYCYRFDHPNPEAKDVYYNVPISPDILDQWTLHCTMTAAMQIPNYISQYPTHPENKARLFDKADTYYAILNGFFNSLPIGEFEKKLEFYPLLLMPEIMDDIRWHIDEIKKHPNSGGPCPESLIGRLHRSVSSIRYILGVYHENILQVAKQLFALGEKGTVFVPKHVPSTVAPASADLLGSFNLQDANMQEIKLKAAHMMKYYFGGFRGTGVRLVNACEAYMNDFGNNTKRESKRQAALGMLEMRQNAYSRILFDCIANDSSYYPLFVARSLLKTQENYVERFLSLPKKPDAHEFHAIRSINFAIEVAGQVYCDKIDSLFGYIHSIPQEENFHVQITPLISQERQYYSASKEYFGENTSNFLVADEILP